MTFIDDREHHELVAVDVDKTADEACAGVGAVDGAGGMGIFRETRATG
jgi:hypothetical protein